MVTCRAYPLFVWYPAQSCSPDFAQSRHPFPRSFDFFIRYSPFCLRWRRELIFRIKCLFRNRVPIFSWVKTVHKPVKCLAQGHNDAAYRPRLETALFLWSLMYTSSADNERLLPGQGVDAFNLLVFSQLLVSCDKGLTNVSMVQRTPRPGSKLNARLSPFCVELFGISQASWELEPLHHYTRTIY